MSKQDARKITIVEELLKGRFTNAQAAQLLDLSVRQTQRLKSEAAKNGVVSVLHKRRGIRPANALDAALANRIVDIYLTELSGYNFCHAADILAEEKGTFVLVSTLSRLLKSNGIRSPKAKRRPKKHRSRDARPHEGELVQMDASLFDWLGNGSCLHLHGAIDDATGKVLALHFDREETFEGYCELIFQMNQDGHLPRELYTDARSVFVYEKTQRQRLSLAEELAGKVERGTQFARAMMQLDILLIIAHSPQAKGGIERLWGTLQDRLTKDLCRQGIATIEQANAFLKRYIHYYNRKYAVQPTCPDSAYLASHNLEELQIILSRHETRLLDSGLSFSFYNQKYTLPVSAPGKNIPASPHDTLTIATSSRIGMQVIFNNLVFEPVLLKSQPKASLDQVVPHSNSPVVKQPVPRPQPASHPWRTHSTMFNYAHTKDVILPAQLSP